MRTTRNKLIFAALVLTMCFPAFVRADEGLESHRFALKLYGGGSWASGSDVNASMQGASDYYETLGTYLLSSADGGYLPAHLGLEFGAEFIYRLTPRIGLGGGVGYVQASRESALTLTGWFAGDMSFRPSFSAVPVRLGGYYVFPICADSDLTFDAGLGYYFGRVDYSLDYDFGTIRLDYKQLVNGGGIGFHAGLTWQYRLSPVFGLFVQAAGRYANIGGWEGTVTSTSTEGTDSATGKAYFGDFSALGRTFPIFFISPTDLPGEVPRLKVDFSGISLRFGVMIHL